MTPSVVLWSVLLISPMAALGQELEQLWSQQTIPFDQPGAPDALPRLAEANWSNRAIAEMRGQSEFQERLIQNLKSLSIPRSRADPENLEKVADRIGKVFKEQGLRVERPKFQDDGQTFENVIGVKQGIGIYKDELVVVLAHMDSVPGTPGADDNASSITALLEIARSLAVYNLDRTLVLAALNLEESGHGGARALLKSIKDNGSKVRLVINLEMIGHRDMRPGSQALPPALETPAGMDALLRASPGLITDLLDFFRIPRKQRKGDFLAVIGNRPALLELVQQADSPKKAKVLSMIAPTELSQADFFRGDHSIFWDEGYPAVFVTDTAEYRNPNYHRSTDSPETIDPEFLAENISFLTDWVKKLTEPAQSLEGEIARPISSLIPRSIGSGLIEEQIEFWKTLRVILNDDSVPIPEAARGVKHLWAGGLFSGLFPNHFSSNLKRMSDLGLDSAVIPINTVFDSPGNMKKIEREIASSPRPVALYGHSRGGVQILDAYILLPQALKDKVEKIILIAAPILGANSADTMFSKEEGRLRPWTAAAVDRLLFFGGLAQTVRELTSNYRLELGKDLNLRASDLAKIIVITSRKDSTVYPFEGRLMGAREIRIPNFVSRIGEVKHEDFVHANLARGLDIPAVITEAIVRRVFQSPRSGPDAAAWKAIERKFNLPDPFIKHIINEVVFPEFVTEAKGNPAILNAEAFETRSTSVLADAKIFYNWMREIDGGRYLSAEALAQAFFEARQKGFWDGTRETFQKNAPKYSDLVVSGPVPSRGP